MLDPDPDPDLDEMNADPQPSKKHNKTAARFPYVTMNNEFYNF